MAQSNHEAAVENKNPSGKGRLCRADLIVKIDGTGDMIIASKKACGHDRRCRFRD